MKDDYLDAYPDLYRRHWWWRARERFVLDTLESLEPPPPAAPAAPGAGEAGWGRILDVGCGEGLFLPRLARLGEVEGVDPSARTDGPPEGTVHRVPFDARFQPPHRYGLILMLDVLEHLDDPDAALAHAYTLLRPGGTLLVTVPAFRALWTSHDELNRHRTRYHAGELAAELTAAGFRVDRTRYFFHWLAGAKALVRMKEALLGGEPRVPALPPRPLNALLEIVSRADHALGSLIRPPVGSSLLAVAVRP